MPNPIFHLGPPESYGYRSAKPFAHVQIADFWDDGFLRNVADEVDAFTSWDGERHFEGAKARRWCSSWDKLPPHTEQLINESSRPEFLNWLEAVTGEKNLIPDPYLNGGGIQCIDTGGWLAMHADFNWHPELALYRRINMLVYLNRDWQDEWGGSLKLAAAQTTGSALDVTGSVSPRFNNTLIFTTDDRSYHGVPDPISAPEGKKRFAIALFYYGAHKPRGSAGAKRRDSDYKSVDGTVLRGRRTLARRIASRVKRMLPHRRR